VLLLLALILLSAFVDCDQDLWIDDHFGATAPPIARCSPGLAAQPVTLIGPARCGGRVSYSASFAVMLLYAVIRPSAAAETRRSFTAPAASYLGASFSHSAARSVRFLTCFNLCMARLLRRPCSAGRYLTLPVLIERTILGEVRYGRGGALATVLMITVVAINLQRRRCCALPARTTAA